MRRKLMRNVFLCVAVGLIAIQFFQPDRTNPPVNPASTFDAVARPDPGTAAIIQRACQDCHSNSTVWPWYSRIAPVSWLIAGDVKEGRAHLNFSEWSYYGPDMSMMKLKQICGEVKEGGMPLWQYRLLHPAARLSQQDIEQLCNASGPIADLQP
jgi:hypothetical protein